MRFRRVVVISNSDDVRQEVAFIVIIAVLGVFQPKFNIQL